MPYEFLEDVGTADIAFDATARDLPELFSAAAEATMNVMIDNLDAIEPREKRKIHLENEDVEMLLFDFLQELIYFKDTEQLVLRVLAAHVDEKDPGYFLRVTVAGEKLDPQRHQQRADVKAVTLHRFKVEKIDSGWRATVILDI